MRPKPDSELNETAETATMTTAPCDFGNPKIRKSYDGAFKLHAVLKLLRGEKQTDVGQELGVSQPLLSIWKRRALAAVCRELGVAANNEGKLLTARDSRPSA